MVAPTKLNYAHSWQCAFILTTTFGLIDSISHMDNGPMDNGPSDRS